MSAPLNPAEKVEGLPEPWLRQFDSTYGCYFYIDPTTTPPTVSWVHPLEKDGSMHPEQIQAIKNTLDQELQAEGHAAPPAYDPANPNNNPYLQQQERPKRRRNYDAADGQLLEKMGKPLAEVEAEERARREAEAADPVRSRGALSSLLGAALSSGGGRHSGMGYGGGMGGMGMGGMGGGVPLGMLLGSSMSGRPSRYHGGYSGGYYTHTMGPPPFGMYRPMMGGGMGGMGMMPMGGGMGGMGMMPMGGMGMGGMGMGGMGYGHGRMGGSSLGMLAPLLMGGMAGGMMGGMMSDGFDGGYEGGYGSD